MGVIQTIKRWFGMIFSNKAKEEFDVKNFYVNIDVQNNGDAIIEYYFDLNGSYNGYDLKIDFKNNNTFYFNSNLNSLGGSELNNGTGIELISIMGVNKNDNFDFINVSGDTFKEVDAASTGKYGVYLYNQDRNGMSLKIFNPSKKKKAFYWCVFFLYGVIDYDGSYAGAAKGKGRE